MNRSFDDIWEDIQVLWDFSRPHTVIGSTLAVVTFYLVSSHESGVRDSLLFWITYGAAIAVNIYIVGLNQLTDVSIDRINKPHLPIPSGRLRAHDAARIVAVSGILAWGLAFAGGAWLIFTIGTVFLVGSAYSLPPLRLKRYPIFAALSIVLSRGVVGNFGLWLTFEVSLGGAFRIPMHLIVFVAFMIGFLTVIALLKDAPDIKGDEIHEVRTYSVQFGAQKIVYLSVGLLSAFYVGMILLGLLGAPGVHGGITIITHALLLGVLLKYAGQCDPNDKTSLANLYQGIWSLYYLEFGAYLLACLSA